MKKFLSGDDCPARRCPVGVCMGCDALWSWGQRKCGCGSEYANGHSCTCATDFAKEIGVVNTLVAGAEFRNTLLDIVGVLGGESFFFFLADEAKDKLRKAFLSPPGEDTPENFKKGYKAIHWSPPYS